MNKTETYRILDATQLKLIAMICMLIDHLGDFFPNMIWMKAVGRIAMPLFSFMISEGYFYTHDKLAYLKRMLIFALISEIPFDLFIYGKLYWNHQNIMFTFAICIIALLLRDRIVEKKKDYTGLLLGNLAALVIGAVLTLLLRTDYSFYPVLLILLFHHFRDYSHLVKNLIVFAFQVATRNMGHYIFGALSVIPLVLYNGKKGKGFKYLFYVFYPAHFLILYLIRLLIIK